MNPISLGAVLSAIGVILGAFGAHAIKSKVGYDLYEIYLTSTHYWMLHAFAILLYGLALNQSLARAKWPLWSFGFGILVFSGSLYALVYSNLRMLGAITPIGGVLFIAGWIGFAKETWQRKI